MNEVTKILIAALAGGCMQELLHWYADRTDIMEKLSRFQKNGSASVWKFYWLITFGMIVGSVLGTLFWFEGRLSETRMLDAMIIAAAFPGLFRNLVGSAVQRDASKLGGDGMAAKGEAESRNQKGLVSALTAYFQ